MPNNNNNNNHNNDYNNNNGLNSISISQLGSDFGEFQTQNRLNYNNNIPIQTQERTITISQNQQQQQTTTIPQPTNFHCIFCVLFLRLFMFYLCLCTAHVVDTRGAVLSSTLLPQGSFAYLGVSIYSRVAQQSSAFSPLCLGVILSYIIVHFCCVYQYTYSISRLVFITEISPCCSQRLR